MNEICPSNRTNVLTLQVARERARQPRGGVSKRLGHCGILKPLSSANGDYLSGSKPRMRSFEAAWWTSCSRFKHCARVPDVAATWPVFDDDASAKTRLHDLNPRR